MPKYLEIPTHPYPSGNRVLIAMLQKALYFVILTEKGMIGNSKQVRKQH